MKNKLFLHVGQPKTGSTSIQKSLIDNSYVLQSKGFYQLIDFEKTIKKRLACYCFSDGKFTRERVENGITTNEGLDDFRAAVERDLYEEIKKNIQGDWVISSEALTELMFFEEKENLKFLLSKFFSKIVVICYFRNQSDHLVSGHSQKVKSGASNDIDLIGTLAKRVEKYNYYEFCESWIQVFGKDNFIPKLYHKNNFIKGDLIEDFYATCGISTAGMNLNYHENLSLSESGTRILGCINELLNSRDIQLTVEERSRLVRIVGDESKSKSLSLDKDQIVEIMNRFDESNKLFIDKFFSDIVFNPLT